MSHFIPRFWAIIRLGMLILLSSGNGAFNQAKLVAGQEKQPAPAVGESSELESPANQKQLNELSELLTNSRWTGRFTTIDKDGVVGKASKETYEITKADKLSEKDLWLLTTRIKYGKRDVTVPLPITILWAGKTPVITVDQLLIPGMGTFDARVLIRGGKYSGTWTHNDHGGHLFGKIEKMEPEVDTKPEVDAKPNVE